MQLNKRYMHIGVSSPLTVVEFLPYLNDKSKHLAAGIIGLKAPAVDSMIHSFLKKGHKISVYTLTTEVDSRLILRGENITIYVNPLRKNGRIKAFSFFNKEANHIFESIKLDSNLPDILHAHWTYEYAKGVLKFKNKIPVIITIRDWAPKILKLNVNYYRFARYIMDFKLFKTSGVDFIANSGYIKEKVKKRWGLDVDVVPNGVSNRFLEEVVHDNTRKKSILSVSNNISKAKNIENLLIAFQKIIRDNYTVELNLVGKQFYDTIPQVRKWQESGLLQNVNLIGEVDHVELKDEYDKAFLLVHPSLEESFGNILIEAMARGLPIIAGKYSGAVPFVLDNGNVGSLCDVRKSDEIFDEILKLINNNPKMQSMSLKGIKHVKEHYSQEAVYKKLFSIYTEKIRK